MMLRHVRREGRQALLDALLVADVGEHLLEDRHPRAGVGGDMQAALRHQRQQAHGLERHRLAAGVRAGDQQDAEAAAQLDGDRHDARR